MSFTGLEAVAVGDVDVDDVLPGRTDARRDVSLLDIHVEEISHDRDPTTDLLGECDALLKPVDEVLLVTVERLEEDRHASVAGRRRELFQLLHKQLTLELCPRLIRGQVGQARRRTELRHRQEADRAERRRQLQPPAHQFLPRGAFGRVRVEQGPATGDVRRPDRRVGEGLLELPRRQIQRCRRQLDALEPDAIEPR